MTEPTAENRTSPRPEERNWALAAHLGPIVVSLVSAGFFGWIVPLVVWLTQKDTSPFAAEHAKESLNFRITLFVAYFISAALILVVIGIFLLPLVFLAEIVFAVIASLKASNGEPYRYPFAIRLIS